MKCAVYRCWDAHGKLLYVGCSPNPLSRVGEHARFKAWAQNLATITVEWFDGKPEALAAEKAAIQKQTPEWNVHHSASPKRCAPPYLVDLEDEASWVPDRSRARQVQPAQKSEGVR